jgi:hypothetical protein
MLSKIYGRWLMVTIEQLAIAALNKDSLKLRSLYQDMISEAPRLFDCPRPQTDDLYVLVVAASLVELLAERLHQSPPAWTNDIGALPEPMHLLASAAKMKRLRILCETQSPEPLRKRGLYAPPNFLEFA